MQAHDLRFPMPLGAGSDARHGDPRYSLATCILESNDGLDGTGFALTLGRGNELVVAAINALAPLIIGTRVEESVMSLGRVTSEWSNESQLRWVGPHKGVIHLALAAVTVALIDLWAKSKNRPLWRLLLDMSPEQVVSLVDFSTIADILPAEKALQMLKTRRLSDSNLDSLLNDGYPAYDTSVGWLGYDVEHMVENLQAALDRGFQAVKIKVGSNDIADDVRRLSRVRECVGPEVDVMIDANQRWGVAEAIEAGTVLAPFDIFWFEEPVHPDDLLGYRDVSRALTPMRIAGGEHLSNPVLFKNFIRAGSVQVVQPDAVRLAGVAEYLAVALLACQAGLPAVPHIGDMGQLHQHLVVFTRIALGMPLWPLEMIPHLADHFAEPAEIVVGHYRLPRAPGASTTLKPEAVAAFRQRP